MLVQSYKNVLLYNTIRDKRNNLTVEPIRFKEF